MDELALAKRELEASEDLFFKKTIALIKDAIRKIGEISEKHKTLSRIYNIKRVPVIEKQIAALISDIDDLVAQIEGDMDIAEGLLSQEVAENLKRFEEDTYLQAVAGSFSIKAQELIQLHNELDSLWEELKKIFAKEKTDLRQPDFRRVSEFTVFLTKTITQLTNISKTLNVEVIDKMLLRQDLANRWIDSLNLEELKQLMESSMNPESVVKLSVRKLTRHEKEIRGENFVRGIENFKFKSIVIMFQFDNPHFDYYSDHRYHTYGIEYDTNIDKFVITHGRDDSFFPTPSEFKATADDFHEAVEKMARRDFSK